MDQMPPQHGQATLGRASLMLHMRSTCSLLPGAIICLSLKYDIHICIYTAQTAAYSWVINLPLLSRIEPE